MTLRFAPLFLPLLAAAQSTEEPEPPAIQLNTETAFRGFVFFAEDEQGLYGGRSELVFAPDLELELPSNARFETALQARVDAVDSSRNRLYLYEGFLDLSFESWDIRTGRQIVRTGRVDGMRPTDYFRRRDFTDFLEADEEPIDAVRVDRYEKDWVFTGVWAPYFQSDILPLDPRNPWTAPLLPPTPGGTTPSYVVNDASSPAGLDSSEVGLWAGRRTGGVDWSASYFYGHDRIPSSYTARPLPPAASGETLTVELFPGYQRLHVLGLDGETTWGDFVFRGETTYTRPGDPSGSHTLDQAPYAMLALGADRTLSRIVGSQDAYVNLQYLFDSAPAPVVDPTAPEFGNPLRHFYRHAMTGLLEYRFDPYRKLVTQAFFNLTEHDYAVQSEFNWKPSDGWTWSIGLDLTGGPEESFFGTYAANDRLRTALTFDWQAWQFRRSPPSEAQPPPGMELQTTAWVGGEWVAVINGQRVRSGDVVEGATVVDIADGIVAMELVGRSFTLRF